MAKNDSKAEKPAMSEGAKSYLILYNSVQLTAWTYLLSRIVSHFLAGKGAETLYQENKVLVQVFQNAAILEIFHVMFGLVRSDLMTTVMQVFSRVMLCLGVLVQSTEAQGCFGITPMLTAWSLSEIVRYSFYTVNLLTGSVPYFITWCRYTFFYILYPVGVSGELICSYYCLQTLNESKAHYISPEYATYFKYFLVAVMVTYIPGFPKMYYYMINQRRKVIGGSSSTKKTQ
ncbi:very-long-chain (3R)-3-hydroxyacyl-CoA dehydratase hpo-8 [Cimex lectularius]|uniref:Very-long-chain (3R)-3-hydroxyacyl-CoA dehydratase n=1 Tax=Cimex lectularius TaxID=79782 RepID=A0A8I6RI47_CIMLE|nr:very-long-chain (3R)-3-hydroxyacyl-CoA dehydratase hpo-8 [Cimex lectularius]